VPKINVYLPEDLAAAVRDVHIPVSAICQTALERAVRDATSLQATDEPPPEGRPGVGPFRRFTPRARKAMALAEEVARGIPHNYVGTEHVLLGVIDEGSNLALKVVKALDLELEDVRTEVLASMGPPTERPGSRIRFTPLAKKALESATSESRGMFHNYIGCEHLLLGLLATEDGLASQVLRRMGVELHTTRRAVITALSGFVQARQQQAKAEGDGDELLQEILRRLDAIERRLAS
jgi:ATP-dependent Clp protease ATP-binding subunit ClpA